MSGRVRTSLILVVPLLYLAATLLYSAWQAVWGVQVDPESAYTMNGLVAAAGYGSLKFDHPGTTTTLLVELIIRGWALVARPDDIVAFGLKHYDAITYAARTCEALVLAGALLAGGLIVGRTTRSAIAAMLFQAGAFVHPDAFHFQTVLAPESLMVAIALFGMAIVLKAALDERPPATSLGVVSGLIFALGFSTKYLYLPQALFAVCLLRNRRAFVAALITGAIGFVGFSLIFNPGTITRGFGWLVQIATHKGHYGEGETGFIDFAIVLVQHARDHRGRAARGGRLTSQPRPRRWPGASRRATGAIRSASRSVPPSWSLRRTSWRRRSISRCIT